jgi:hypothetical protein
MERTPSPEHGASNNTLSYLAAVSFCNIFQHGNKSPCHTSDKPLAIIVISNVSIGGGRQGNFLVFPFNLIGSKEFSWVLTTNCRRSAWMSVIISSRPCTFTASLRILKRPLFTSRAHIFPVTEYTIITSL